MGRKTGINLEGGGAAPPRDTSDLDRPDATGMPVCKVCGEEIHQDRVDCVSCVAPHHRDCWEFNGGCSIYGCGGTEAVMTPAGLVPHLEEIYIDGRSPVPDFQEGHPRPPRTSALRPMDGRLLWVLALVALFVLKGLQTTSEPSDSQRRVHRPATRTRAHARPQPPPPPRKSSPQGTGSAKTGPRVPGNAFVFPDASDLPRTPGHSRPAGSSDVEYARLAETMTSEGGAVIPAGETLLLLGSDRIEERVGGLILRAELWSALTPGGHRLNRLQRPHFQSMDSGQTWWDEAKSHGLDPAQEGILLRDHGSGDSAIPRGTRLRLLPRPAGTPPGVLRVRPLGSPYPRQVPASAVALSP